MQVISNIESKRKSGLSPAYKDQRSERFISDKAQSASCFFFGVELQATSRKIPKLESSYSYKNKLCSHDDIHMCLLTVDTKIVCPFLAFFPPFLSRIMRQTIK